MKMLLKCGALLVTGLAIGEAAVRAGISVAVPPVPTAPPVPVTSAARAYLAAHPLPSRKGMVGGIILGPDDPWVPVLTPCPAAHHGSATANAWPCGAWGAWLMTPSGRIVTAWCGYQGPRGRGTSCIGDLTRIPSAGGEVYVPASLRFTRATRVRVVKWQAVNAQSNGYECAIGDRPGCGEVVTP